MDRLEALRRMTAARVGRLATADGDGKPHVVPFVFAVKGDTIYWVVDDKPKRSRSLKRLENIRANPRVEAVVDHYDDDWGKLWWVRAAGVARVVGDVEEEERARALLASKYQHYAANPPPGPIVAIRVERVSGWSARP